LKKDGLKKLNDISEPRPRSCLARIIEGKPMGTLRIAGPRMSRYDFAIRIARVPGLDKNFIKPAKMSDMKWIAKRPRDSSLDTTRAKTC